MPPKANPLADVWSAAAFRAVRAGYKLGIFDALREGPLTAAEIAGYVQCDERGVRLLLETLEIFGYVTRADNHYSNSEIATDFAAPFDFWGTLVFELWSDLEQSIRNGTPPTDFYQWLEQHPHELRIFQGMLRGIAHAAAPEVVEKVKMPANARRLLDIGGSHAEFSSAFCRQYEQLTATVFDLPGALQSAAAHDRISLQPGNFLRDDFGTGYDIALLMSVVHGHLPDVNIDLLRRVAAALNPGGQVVILEQLANPKKKTNTFNRIFSLNLYHLQGGQTYSYEEIAQWLTAAGFKKPRRINLRSGDSLIVGTQGGGDAA